jgi:hypothetical protein
MIVLFGVIWGLVIVDEVCQPRIRTSRVVRRIGKREDVLIIPDWEPSDTSELGVLEFLSELFEKVVAALHVGGKSLTKAFNGFRWMPIHLECKM